MQLNATPATPATPSPARPQYDDQHRLSTVHYGVPPQPANLLCTHLPTRESIAITRYDNGAPAKHAIPRASLSLLASRASSSNSIFPSKDEK